MCNIGQPKTLTGSNPTRKVRNSAFHQFKVKNEVAPLAKLGFETKDSESKYIHEEVGSLLNLLQRLEIG